jgi:hypothetical protein
MYGEGLSPSRAANTLQDFPAKLRMGLFDKASVKGGILQQQQICVALCKHNVSPHL